jgi:ribosome-binding factor A
VGKQTGIKFVPTLTFIADIVPDTARELEQALERARYADAELARAREGAQYAGEADPYRKPAVDEDDEDDDLEDDDAEVAAEVGAGRTDGFGDERPSATAQRSAS